MAGSAGVTISLTNDEALVLFDLLQRWGDDKQVSAPLHHAEEVALWNMSCSLESTLVEPFDPSYSDRRSEARARLASAEQRASL